MVEHALALLAKAQQQQSRQQAQARAQRTEDKIFLDTGFQWGQDRTLIDSGNHLYPILRHRRPGIKALNVVKRRYLYDGSSSRAGVIGSVWPCFYADGAGCGLGQGLLDVQCAG